MSLAEATRAYKDALAWAAYRRACAPAQKIRDEIVQPLWEEFQKAIAPADKQFKEATAPFFRKYEEAVELSRKEYEESIKEE